MLETAESNRCEAAVPRSSQQWGWARTSDRHAHTHRARQITTLPLLFQHRGKTLAWGILDEWRRMDLREIWGSSVINLGGEGGMRNTSLQCLLAQQKKYTEKHFQAACRWGCRSYTPLCLLHDSSSQNMHLIIFETEFMNNKVFHLLDWLYHLWTANGNKGF